MELIAVESLLIAAIGYLETDRVLLVRYRDGSLYAQSHFDAEEFAALQWAASKGAWLYSRDRKGIEPTRITSSFAEGRLASAGKEGAGTQSAEAQAITRPAPLNVLDEDADKCCRKNAPKSQQWHRSDTPASWECPICETRFEIGMVGPLRHWRIHEPFAIVRSPS